MFTMWRGNDTSTRWRDRGERAGAPRTPAHHGGARRAIAQARSYFQLLLPRAAGEVVRKSLVNLLGSGKCFFCNSGGEANEGLLSSRANLAMTKGRFEVNHHRELLSRAHAGRISATGQEKVRKGFEPMVPGFRRCRMGIGGDGAGHFSGHSGHPGGRHSRRRSVTPASPEYLRGLRRLCDDRKLLFLMDGVQDGHFRTGRFPELSANPRAGGGGIFAGRHFHGEVARRGFPIGAFWCGRHYATARSGDARHDYGGSPLGLCGESEDSGVIHKESWRTTRRNMGAFLRRGFGSLAEVPQVMPGSARVGLMLGIRTGPEHSATPGDTARRRRAHGLAAP